MFLPTAATTLIEATFAAPDGPMVYEERASRRSALTLAALWLPLFGTLAVPGLALAATASGGEANHGSALGVAIGLLALAAFAAAPLVQLLMTFGQRRRVIADNDMLHIEALSPLGAIRSSMALEAFRGVTHRVRTSLSGIEHEIVLVPRSGGAAVRIHRAERIGSETVAHVACRLGLPEIAATTAPFGAGAGTAIRPTASQALATA